MLENSKLETSFDEDDDPLPLEHDIVSMGNVRPDPSIPTPDANSRPKFMFGSGKSAESQTESPRVELTVADPGVTQSQSSRTQPSSHDPAPSRVTYESIVKALRELLPPESVDEAIATYTRMFERAERHAR